MRWIVILLVGVGVLLAALWALQRSFIYFPTGQLERPPPDIKFEEVTLETSDGLSLGAWHFPPGSPEAATVIAFNGNAGNRSHRISLAAALTEREYGVLLVDYRGYGDNPGSPREEGLAADARAARDYVEAAGVDMSRVVYFGESLGAAVALDLAREHPPASLILRSPFTSLADVGSYHYPFVPVSFLLRDEYASIGKVADLEAPLLVIAGSDDDIVPASQSRALWGEAPEPKELLILDGAMHNDLELLSGAEMINSVDDFITRHVGG